MNTNALTATATEPQATSFFPEMPYISTGEAALLRELLRPEPPPARVVERDFELLYSEMRRPLYAVAQRRFGLEPHVADDVIQQLWVLYLERHETIRSSRSWLLGALVNLCRRAHQRVARERFVEIDEAEWELPVNEPAVNEDALAMREVLAEVDERTRALCVLLAVDGLSYREVADELSLPIGSVGPLYMRARAALRELLCPVVN